MTFQRGDRHRPKGHALAYFRVLSEPDVLYATYIITLPIEVDFSKYVPPFLSSHLGSAPLNDLSAFSLPPVPEKVGSYGQLEHLAEVRDDDLLDAGTMNSFDLPDMMQLVGDMVRQYAQLWSDYAKPEAAPEQGEAPRELGEPSGVTEVLYSLMNERDRLADLASLVSKLRFAIEGSDKQMGQETKEEIEILGRYLPEHFQISRLLSAAMDYSARGAQLAQLYLDRCYKLSNRDDAGAKDLDDKIDILTA